MSRLYLFVSLAFLCLGACAPLTRPLPTVTPVPNPSIGSTQVSKKDGMVMVFIPTGDFVMGSMDSDPDAEPDTKPQHTVYLDAFWIDRTEVTNAMYAQCIEAGPCRLLAELVYDEKPEHADYPVKGVTWEMAQTYCEWAGLRLPSEAEWEKAARGTDGRLYPWGNETPNLNLANFQAELGKGPNGEIVKAGSYPAGASPYGTLDMAGNLWEWVEDWYSNTYFASSPRENPRGPLTGAYRACRGGSWDSPANDIRVTNRGMTDPSHCDGLATIRCASSDMQ